MKFFKRVVAGVGVVALSACLALTACGSKLTAEDVSAMVDDIDVKSVEVGLSYGGDSANTKTATSTSVNGNVKVNLSTMDMDVSGNFTKAVSSITSSQYLYAFVRDGAVYDYIGTSDVSDISKVTLNQIDIQQLLNKLLDNGLGDEDITPDGGESIGNSDEDVDGEMSIETTDGTSEFDVNDFSYLLGYVNIDTDNIDVEKTASQAIKDCVAACFNFANEYDAVEYGKDNVTIDINAFVYNYYTELLTALNSIKDETKLSEILALKPVKATIEFLTNSVDVKELYTQAMNYLENKLTVQMSVGAMTQEQANDLLSFPAPEEGDTFYSYLVKLVASPKFTKLIGVLLDIDELQSGIVSIGDLTVGGLLNLANESEGTKLSLNDLKTKVNEALSTYISGDKTAFTITVPGKITSTKVTIKDMKAVYSFKNKKLSGVTTSATVTVAKVLGQTTASTTTSNATVTVNFYEEALMLTDISSQIASGE